jgi:hypothetical protein
VRGPAAGAALPRATPTRHTGSACLARRNESLALPLRFRFEPTSMFRTRLLLQMRQSMELLKQVGFSEHDVDEVKELLSVKRPSVLILTFAVSMVRPLLRAAVLNHC